MAVEGGTRSGCGRRGNGRREWRKGAAERVVGGSAGGWRWGKGGGGGGGGRRGGEGRRRRRAEEEEMRWFRPAGIRARRASRARPSPLFRQMLMILSDHRALIRVMNEKQRRHISRQSTCKAVARSRSRPTVLFVGRSHIDWQAGAAHQSVCGFKIDAVPARVCSEH